MRFIILLILCLCITISAKAAEEKVYEYQLNNGLKLFVKVDRRASAVVSEVWYKVGSSFESSGVTGISHMLEHMMFKGTPKYGPGKFSQIIAEQGGDENAFTSYDYTVYYQFMENDKLPISFELEADRMKNLSLKGEDFSKELEVVKEERRLRTDDNPQALTYERFQAAAHIANPYHHPIIGWMSDLIKLKIEDVRHWYNSWYAPNNAILVVVGNVDPEKVYLLAKRYFGNIPSKQLPEMKWSNEVSLLGERRVVVAAPAKLPWIILGFNTPVLKTSQSRWEPFALLALAGILDEGASSRLAKNLIRDKQIATVANANYDLYSRFDDLFTLDGIPSPGHTTQELLNAFKAEIKKLQTELVSAKELQRVKAQLIAGRVYDKDSMIDEANEIGALESVGLSWREADNYIKSVEAVTPEQIRIVAQKYLIPERSTVTELKPLPLPTDVKEQQLMIPGQSYVR